MIHVREMPVRFGNAKLGKDTCIFNMTTAMDCPSFKKGFCKIRSLCYAIKAEFIWPDVLKFREEQNYVWNKESAMSIASSMMRQINRRIIKTKYIRFSESGDFTTQADIDKLSKIAKIMHKWQFYGYTNRHDLDFSSVPLNVAIQGNGSMIHNQINVVKKATGKYFVCPGNCKVCNFCKVRRGQVLEMVEHGHRWNKLENETVCAA